MIRVCEVRENADPTGSRRIKVRCYGIHNDEKNIPDEGLKWVHPLYPISAIPNGGIGSTFPAPMINSKVLCMFLEENGEQTGYYIGGVSRAESADVQGIQEKDPKNGGKSPTGLKAPDNGLSIA